MTRTFTNVPVWTWLCDRCGATSGDLAWNQQQLPTPDEMRTRGWFVADLHGDLCSRCKAGDPSLAPITRKEE